MQACVSLMTVPLSRKPYGDSSDCKLPRTKRNRLSCWRSRDLCPYRKVVAESEGPHVDQDSRESAASQKIYFVVAHLNCHPSRSGGSAFVFALASASGYPKALALGLTNHATEAGFSPWGIASFRCPILRSCQGSKKARSTHRSTPFYAIDGRNDTLCRTNNYLNKFNRLEYFIKAKNTTFRVSRPPATHPKIHLLVVQLMRQIGAQCCTANP